MTLLYAVDVYYYYYCVAVIEIEFTISKPINTSTIPSLAVVEDISFRR